LLHRYADSPSIQNQVGQSGIQALNIIQNINGTQGTTVAQLTPLLAMYPTGSSQQELILKLINDTIRVENDVKMAQVAAIKDVAAKQISAEREMGIAKITSENEKTKILAETHIRAERVIRAEVLQDIKIRYYILLVFTLVGFGLAYAGYNSTEPVIQLIRAFIHSFGNLGSNIQCPDFSFIVWFPGAETIRQSFDILCKTIIYFGSAIQTMILTICRIIEGLANMGAVSVAGIIFISTILFGLLVLILMRTRKARFATIFGTISLESVEPNYVNEQIHSAISRLAINDVSKNNMRKTMALLPPPTNKNARIENAMVVRTRHF
jgi:hypothetical protein